MIYKKEILQQRLRIKQKSGTAGYDSRVPNKKLWEWSIRDLNPWPPHCQCGALPTALMPHAENIVSYLALK